MECHNVILVFCVARHPSNQNYPSDPCCQGLLRHRLSRASHLIDTIDIILSNCPLLQLIFAVLVSFLFRNYKIQEIKVILVNLSDPSEHPYPSFRR